MSSFQRRAPLQTAWERINSQPAMVVDMVQTPGAWGDVPVSAILVQ